MNEPPPIPEFRLLDRPVGQEAAVAWVRATQLLLTAQNVDGVRIAMFRLKELEQVLDNGRAALQRASIPSGLWSGGGARAYEARHEAVVKESTLVSGLVRDLANTFSGLSVVIQDASDEIQVSGRRTVAAIRQAPTALNVPDAPGEATSPFGYWLTRAGGLGVLHRHHGLVIANFERASVELQRAQDALQRAGSLARQLLQGAASASLG